MIWAVLHNIRVPCLVFPPTFLHYLCYQHSTVHNIMPYPFIQCPEIKYRISLSRTFRDNVQNVSNWCIHSLTINLRASAANTPRATSPEDVSHSRGRNVEGKESWEMEDAGTSEEDDDIDSQDSNTPIDHGHVARNCSIKIKWLLQLKSSFSGHNTWPPRA